MRLKSQLYKKEQEEIIDNICYILDFKNRNNYNLYELDNNVEIQKNNGINTRNTKMVFI